MNEIALQAPYGRIHMNVMKRNDITPKQKLVYAIIAAKQGETFYAKLSQKMIAEALDISERYVSTTINQLIGYGLVAKEKNATYSTINNGRQYGMVEVDILITTNLSKEAKYLYLIYCTVGSKEYDANTWGSKKVCAEFKIGMTTYQNAHKELIDKGILKVYGKASGHGVQTSNMNRILRVDKFEISRPASWTPSEPLDIDSMMEEILLDEQSVEPVHELSVIENMNSEYNLTGTVDRTNSNLNINLNNNLNITTNEGMDPPEVVSQTRNINEEEEEVQMDEAKIALFGKLAYKKSRTVEAAAKILTDIHDKAELPYLPEYTDDATLLKKAFVAFDTMRESLEEHGVDTSGFGLDCDDLTLFLSFYKRVGPLSEDRIIYHVRRVVQLGMEKVGKKYIAFSYLFSEFAELKQEPVFV